jgi:cadmium resistance protein CadD (predicted permease)
MGISAEQLSTIGGIATVSTLHAFIPTHWLPFSVVGRAQKWSLGTTLLVTALGAFCHTASTALLGLGAVKMAHSFLPEEVVHSVASILLVVLGLGYVILFLTGKGGHSHGHSHSMEKAAVAGLILVPTLSPCATVLPVFLAVGNSEDGSFLVLVVVLLLATLTVMLGLVTVSFLGAAQLKFEFMTRYDKLLVGIVLCLVGILTNIFHHHDHEETLTAQVT